MSDSDSIDSSPTGSGSPHRTLSDFPLSEDTLRTNLEEIDRALRRLHGVTGQLSRTNLSAPLSAPVDVALSGDLGENSHNIRQTGLRVPVQQNTFQTQRRHPRDPARIEEAFQALQEMQEMDGWTQGNTVPAPPPESNNVNVPKTPAVTLVPLLPKTTYKDEDDTKGMPKSLAYVRAQLAVLKYLETQASDTLTPYQARKWTQAIDPTHKEPKAEEALRLCYYMRSQGYDTGADLEHDKKMIHLYVARGDRPEHKLSYWKQNFETNEVVFMAASPPRQPRRNAIFGLNMAQETQQRVEERDRIHTRAQHLARLDALLARDVPDTA